MTHKLKKGQLRLEGAEPMSFVESDDVPSLDLTAEQQAAMQTVSSTIRTYLKTAQSLVAEKYKHLEDIVPEYLSNPGNVLIVVCPDGVVIRYESKVGEDRKLAVSFMPDGIAHAALILSQNLVRVQDSSTSIVPDEKLGLEIKLSVVSPEGIISRELTFGRVWFDVTNKEPEHPHQSLTKPYCLLSVRNSLEIEIHGELGAAADSTAARQPFIAKSQIRLGAGWECIEVFPGLDINDWKPEFAPLWAENDLLSAALIAQLRDEQHRSLDPKAATRKIYCALLAKFREMLDSAPEREQTLQIFLQANPILLCPTHVRMWPKLPLGAKVTDFVFRDASHEYLLVELERSTLPLFRQDGHPTAELTHAQGQIVDWKRYLEDNLQTVQRELGLEGVTPNPNGLIVIGRSSALLPENRRKLQTMTNESPN